MAEFTSIEDEEFFGAIGRLALSWGHLEVGLDLLVHLVHNNLNGHERIEARPPLALQRKLEYLRKAFRTLPHLAPFKDRFIEIAEKVSSASEERHDIIHGFVVHHAEGTGEAAMVRLLPSNRKPKPFVVTTTTILKAAVYANRIGVLNFASEVAASLSDTSKIS